MYRFAKPEVAIEDLVGTPLLMVRAGSDATPGLNTSFDRFVDKARARELSITVIEHSTGPHAFDILDDSPRSHEVINEVLGFIRRIGSFSGAVQTLSREGRLGGNNREVPLR